MKLERTTEEGETPVQIVRGTENPNAMPVVDRIALDNALKQLPPGYQPCLCSMTWKVMSMRRSLRFWALQLVRQSSIAQSQDETAWNLEVEENLQQELATNAELTNAELTTRVPGRSQIDPALASGRFTRGLVLDRPS